MRWSWRYALLTTAILAVEICIALFVRDKFVRPFLGDVLAVALLYFGFRTILKLSPLSIVITVLIIACGLEALQYFQLVKVLGLEQNKWLRIILGSTFDWLDTLAYFLGGIVAFFTDKSLLN